MNRSVIDGLNSEVKKENKMLKLKRKNLQYKKRMISITSTLQKFSWFILIYAIVAIILLILYPVVNKVISNKYIENNVMNLEELGRLYWTNADFNSYYAAHYVIMSSRLQPGPINLV